MAPSTRLSISVDISLVAKLQALIQLKQKKRVSIAEVIRMALEALDNNLQDL
jgi:Arc/MetJ-type ribon-helix-helix transcriptional regulator